MRAFTLKSEVVAVDRSSKTINTITKSYDKMSKTITQGTKVANRTYTNFANNVGLQAKKIQIGINNVNASINRTFRKISSSTLALGFGIGLIGILTSITSANIELDASIASLQAITGQTGKNFVPFRQEIDNISKSQRMFAGDTAKAFEIIGSAQPVLLGNAKSLSEVTDAAITLKKAGLMPIEDSAKAVTGTMNQFELGAEHAQRVINVLAAGAKEGSANIRELSESMDRVGAVAKSANISVEKTAAAVELLSKYNLKGSEAGISLKSTILRLKAAQLGFARGQFNLNDALEEYNAKANAIQDPIKKAAYEEKVFGKIHILTGKILTENIGELDRLTTAMTGTNEATIQANINNNTLKNRLNEISAAWKNAITSTNTESKQMQALKDLLAKVAENMDRIVSVAVLLVKIFLAYKLIVIAVNVVTKTHNILLGLQAGLLRRASINMRGNIAAMVTMNIVTKAVALATKAWIAVQNVINILLTENPIGIIVVAIGVLIAVIVLLIRHWDKVKTAMTKVWDTVKNNPIFNLLFFNIIRIIKAVIALIRFFKEMKQSIIEVFTSLKSLAKNVIAFFKAVGEFIDVVFKVAIIRIKEFFISIWDRIKSLGSAMKGFTAKLLSPFEGVILFLNRIGSAIQTSILDKFKNLTKFVTGIIDKVSAFFGRATTKVQAKTEQLVRVYGLEEKRKSGSETIKAEVKKNSESSKVTNALDKNTEAINKNTSAAQGEWKGRFKTSIIKDANISERSMRIAQREIANKGMEDNISVAGGSSNILSESIPGTPVTPSRSGSRRNMGLSGRIDINVVDRTGGDFGIQIESTGVEVNTTGNV